MPTSMGLVSGKGENHSLNIKSYLIGDKYAEALGNGLRYSGAQSLNLA